jgi:hypothetical protein
VIGAQGVHKCSGVMNCALGAIRVQRTWVWAHGLVYVLRECISALV